jgi:Tfp pilus assembly protein PilX
MKRGHRKGEEGIALVVALVILLVLTVIGFVAVSTTIFESNIAGNERVATDAFYAAEAVLEVGYNQLPDTTEIPKSGTGDNNRMVVGASSYGWTGTAQDKGSQKPIQHKGLYVKPGYDTSFSFSRYAIQVAGESSGASREIDSMVSYGPYVAGTSYNN